MQRIVYLLFIVCLYATHSLAIEPVKFKVMFVNSNKVKVAGTVICKGDTINDFDTIQWSNNNEAFKVMNLQRKNEKYVLSAVDGQYVSGNLVGTYVNYLKQRQSGFQFQRKINTFVRSHLSYPDINYGRIEYHTVTLLDSLKLDFPSNKVKSEMRKYHAENSKVDFVKYELILDSCNIVRPRDDQHGYTPSPEKMPTDTIRGYLHFQKDHHRHNIYKYETGKIIITRSIYRTHSPSEGLLKIYIIYGNDCYEQQFRIRPVDYDDEENNDI